MKNVLDCLASQDYSSCIPLLAKAVRALPEMSDVIKVLSSDLEEKQQPPPAAGFRRIPGAWQSGEAGTPGADPGRAMAGGIWSRGAAGHAPAG